jgi:sensor histidine kinase regulating citrate/malate metabolism
MKINAYRAGWAALGALVVLLLEETFAGTLLLRDSLFSFHVIAIVLLTIGAAALLRDALRSSSEVTLDPNRHPDLKEDATRLLLPLLATMDEGILIVNSRLDIVLYNDACTSYVSHRSMTIWPRVSFLKLPNSNVSNEYVESSLQTFLTSFVRR